MNQNNQDEDGRYVPNQLDIEADNLCNEVHCSLMRAIDSTHNMPLSEHLLYSSYESYDNIMIEQRKSLNDMMSKLSQCSVKQQLYQNRQQTTTSSTSSNLYNPNISQHNNNSNINTGTDFGRIDNLIDKYDTIHDFTENMFDRIGQNLDDAAGLRSRDAQLVQATLEAASQNKMSSQKTNFRIQPTNLSSSSSSSSSISKQTLEQTNTPQQKQNQSSRAHTQHQQQRQQQQQNYRYNKPSAQSKVIFNPVNSVVQSFSTQHQQTTRNQFGSYLGKQQYGSPNQRFAVLENKNIPRPQDSFKEKIDNSYRPFEPPIKFKPNFMVPLRLNLARDEHGNEYYLHPYEHEIQNFLIKPELITQTTPSEPPELNSTPITLVESVQDLEEMCRHIEAQKEFAVDVEHHSYRSYLGLTCLLQISTRTQDFVIDALTLRSELYRLNESFTNPNIVKVFHGADCDILWLQRDFGVYVVNLFDTSRAAKLMKFAHLSLAFLMKHYCNVESDKSYQLADWRERPLPLPMLQYARADTHFLLYIFDRLRNDLYIKGKQHNKNLGPDLLRNVYERGREICLKRYEKPPFTDISHMSILRKCRSTFNAKQMFAFKELYGWRDAISRELDESVGYVLPNNLMIRIAEYLPREPQGITALCNPIPPTVKKYLSDIHAIILKAIDVPLDETSKVITGSQLNIDPSLRSIDLDTINHKQDIAHSVGVQESGVPNLLDKMFKLNCSNDERQNYRNNTHNSNNNSRSIMQKNVNQTASRLYNFLDDSWTKRDVYNKKNNESIQKQFVSPYHRYESSNKN